MSDPLRNFFDKTKPNFQKDGAWSKYFPLFDVFENLFYSSSRKTSGITHVRDGSDIQRVMAIVWMATFPTMFFGMYNLGYQSSYEVLDVSDEDVVSNFINSNSPFDILINNAGTNRPAKLIDTKIEDFVYVMSLNVRSVINLTRLVVKKMLDTNIKGSIINVSSQMGHVGGPNRTTYCTSKFAIEGFTKSLAIELGPEGIRVNTICPTFIQTPMTEPFLKDDEFKKQVLSMIPMGRLGEISDLMGPFVFLASDASSLMTGSSVLVDGGWTSR